MRRSLFLIALFISVGLVAQKNAPDWLDPVQRANTYSEETYLTALSMETVGKKANLVKKYELLSAAARDQIMQSVIVSINSQTEMNVTIQNTSTNERFERNSVSLTVGDLVGLNVDNYYDSKKRVVYAFAYAKIADLVRYYVNVISSETDKVNTRASQIEQLIRESNQTGAITLVNENKLAFAEIAKASQILVALGESAAAGLEQLADQRLRNQKQLDQIIATGIETDELAQILAGSISVQVLDAQLDPVAMGRIQFESSGLESTFSRNLVAGVYTTLKEISILNLTDAESNQLLLTGMYSLQNDQVVTSVSIRSENNGEFMARTEQGIPINQLELGNIPLLPVNFDKLTMLPDWRLQANSTQIELKPTTILDQPIQLILSESGMPINNIPIRGLLQDENAMLNEVIVKTNEQGVAEIFVPNENIRPGSEYRLDAQVDVATFLNLDRSSEYYKELVRNKSFTVTPVSIKVDYLSPTIYVRATEKSYEGPLEVLVISPAVKGALADLDYAFVESLEEADYLIEITAISRTGQSSELANIAYVDATISMVDRENNKEIYKNSFTNVKGVGSTFGVASSQAFVKAKNSVVEDISYQLEYNQ